MREGKTYRGNRRNLARVGKHVAKSQGVQNARWPDIFKAYMTLDPRTHKFKGDKDVVPT